MLPEINLTDTASVPEGALKAFPTPPATLLYKTTAALVGAAVEIR
ncbi:MAG: hypothetical protein ACRYG7_34010 [Janthinobacterium lividum]